MKLDITIFPSDLKKDVETAKKVEAYGFDGLWTAEVAHNPFFPLTLAGSVTERIHLGTQIAVAFPRSPMVTAQIAWDLAKQTGGRFILGLGTQVRAHIVRRFSTEWSEPAPRMREYIESLRAIWNTWQTDAPLNFRGDHYRFTFMTPFFNPGSISNPDIPVYIAGVNERMCQLAGEVCDGLHAHGFHTGSYLKDVVLANVEDGLKQAGKSRSDFDMVVPIFVVTGRDDAEMEAVTKARKAHIAFYASTPSYKAVMEHNGWHDIREKLSQMARANQWDEMWHEISDDMLEEVAIVGKPDEIADKVKSRYAGLADRICLGWDSDDDATWELWRDIAQAIKN